MGKYRVPLRDEALPFESDQLGHAAAADSGGGTPLWKRGLDPSAGYSRRGPGEERDDPRFYGIREFLYSDQDDAGRYDRARAADYRGRMPD